MVFAAGVVFTLQGVGVLKGSTMSNTTTWSILGPIIALVGAAIAFRSRGKAGPPDDASDTEQGD